MFLSYSLAQANSISCPEMMTCWWFYPVTCIKWMWMWADGLQKIICSMLFTGLDYPYKIFQWRFVSSSVSYIFSPQNGFRLSAYVANKPFRHFLECLIQVISTLQASLSGKVSSCFKAHMWHDITTLQSHNLLFGLWNIYVGNMPNM